MRIIAYSSNLTKMNLLSILSLAVAVLAQGDYDERGNKKVTVDKGPRFCGGKAKQVIDTEVMSFKCKSRNGKSKEG